MICERIRSDIGSERFLSFLGMVVLFASFALAVVGLHRLPRGDHRDPPVADNVRAGYCGCPNKAACAYENERDCGGCCTPGPCRGGNPSCCR